MELIKVFGRLILYKNTYLYPASKFNSVLFPAPDGPNIAVSCPERNVPLIFLNIILFPAKIRNYELI